MKNGKVHFLIIFLLCLSTTAICMYSRQCSDERDVLVVKQTEHGEYVQYLPEHIVPSTRIIVLVHGTPGIDEPAIEVATRFAGRWMEAARDGNHIIIAPAFDQLNFGGYSGPGGGYRGLFGRNIGADEFINMLVDSYQPLILGYDGRFLLYGHSAGGQVVSRFAVKFPERLIAALISAAGSYAFPDPEAAWPLGMGSLVTTHQWPDSDEPKSVEYHPDPDGWLKASQLPIFVVVGGMDLHTMNERGRSLQPGENHVERAAFWVDHMNRLAAENNLKGRVSLWVMPEFGHSSLHLTPVSIELLLQSQESY